jgi:localization factor PodJL
LAEAVKYWKLSADQGNANGQLGYGICLEAGTGVAKNVEEAKKYYKMAMEKGCVLAERAYKKLTGASSGSEGVVEFSETVDKFGG